jgi:hypothetical protein
LTRLAETTSPFVEPLTATVSAADTAAPPLPSPRAGRRV